MSTRKACGSRGTRTASFDEWRAVFASRRRLQSYDTAFGRSHPADLLILYRVVRRATACFFYIDQYVAN